tara:strand:+ start:2644 stop:2826 length:183 start_codon:yes stop_codon:yes gene_type:complete
VDNNTLSIIFGILIGVWILAKISRMAERTRIHQAREELVREIIREKIRKKKLDELYGRDE